MNKQNLDRVIYTLVVALSLAALVLLASSLAFSTDSKVVYQGF